MKKTDYQNKWGELYQKGYRAKYPNEDVIRFVQRHFPDMEKRKNIKILDFGFGTGRHIVYLAKEGFLTYGTEIAKSSIDLTKKWLNKENLKADLKQTEGIEIPYSNNFFDAIIDCASLQHNTSTQIKQIVSEMHRVLKPGGYIFSYCRSKRDFVFKKGKGIKLGTNSFYMKEFVDTPTVFHFFDKKELISLWKKFTKIEIEYAERTINQMNSKIVHFVINIKK